MKHPATLSACVVLVGAALVACDAIIGIEELRTKSDDDDGNPNQQCELPDDCHAAGNSCFLRSCTGGQCSLTDAPPGTPVPSQEDGNCLVVVCGFEGEPVEQPDDADVFVDGNDCTQDLCSGGQPSNPLNAPGTPCAGGVCAASGDCVECLGNQHCSGGLVCSNMVCVPVGCTNMILDGDETDIDCGGPRCGPCGVNKLCEQASDCTSKVCSGSPVKTCQAPTCTDSVKNAQETDQDCGGPVCPACDHGNACMSPDDCVSLVCSCGGVMSCNEPVCQVPTCTDGVQNGGEVASDCQGPCEGTCDPGEPCQNGEHCGSGFCPMGYCVDCTDGLLGMGEQDVDCGGLCPNSCD